jgi:hypothetical protein
MEKEKKTTEGTEDEGESAEQGRVADRAVFSLGPLWFIPPLHR